MIAYSSDGITWTGIGTSIFCSFGSGRGVTWNGRRWVAVGLGTNTIGYSSNGISWTGIGTGIFNSIGYGVAWNRGEGGVFMNNITLNEYGSGLSNRLDIVADKYYNNGFTNMSISITTQVP